MANFEDALAYVGVNEGGFQKSPNDPGNWYNGELLGTKWGISAPVAREHGYLGEMSQLPKSFANAIYRSTYWPGLEAITNQAVATKIMDMRVQFGVSGGSKLAQRAANSVGGSLAVDGAIGPASIAAFNTINASALMMALCDAMENAYLADLAAHPAKAENRDGWLARAARVPSGVYLAAAGVSLLGLAIVIVAGYMLVTQ